MYGPGPFSGWGGGLIGAAPYDKFSFIHVKCPWRRTLPIPDGDISSSSDRMWVAKMYAMTIFITPLHVGESTIADSGVGDATWANSGVGDATFAVVGVCDSTIVPKQA